MLAVGNASGDVFAFATRDGARLARFAPSKVRAPVLAAAVAADGRNLLAAYGGFLFRHELIRGPRGGGGAGGEGGEDGGAEGGQEEEGDDPDFRE